MFNKFFKTTFLSFLAMTSFLVADIKYEIQDIGTLQTHSSQAIALNNQGQILGWYNVDGSVEGKHFFVRDRDGTFHEVLRKENGTGVEINWRYLKDDGKAYGTFDGNPSFSVLYAWDQQNGVVKLGNLPGKDVITINNAGQVLIKSVSEYENGKNICRPVIWQNGKVSKLKGLSGDVGIEAEESIGLDMNNKGEVVGYSIVFLSYKNQIYKQVHATKWVNGQAIDLHGKIPKISNKTRAIAINDLGEILIYVGEIKEYLPKYLLKKEGDLMEFSYDLNKINNIGYVYNYNYDYGVPVSGTKSIIYDRNRNEIFDHQFVKQAILNNKNSTWMPEAKIISVNDLGNIIADGETIYGEKHGMLIVPVE